MLTPPSPSTPPSPAPAGSEGAPPPAPAPALPADSGKAPPPPAPPKEGASERPSWLPEKYKTAEEFRKGYDSVNALVGKSRDEIRDSLKAEITTELTAAQLKERPEAADKYALPEFKDNPNVDVEALGKHELVAWWREQAFARGLPQAEFQAGIDKYVAALSANLPNPDAEFKALGENGKARLEAVNGWIGKAVPAEHMDVVQEIGRTAKGIAFLEQMMKQGGVAKIDITPDGGGRQVEGDTEEMIKALMAKPEYYNPGKRDPSVVARVEKFYKTKYNGPA